jgi:integral membrane sensor domain MASE1/two-component sensor histidine kinase
MNGGVILPWEKGASEIKKSRGSQVPFLSRRNALECLLGGVGVFTLCMIGQEFYKVSGTLAAPLWPSSGLALAILLLGGWRLFPAITLGTIAATHTFDDNLIFSLLGSLANTLESLIGWFLMVRVFGFSNSMTRIRDIMVLILAGAPWGTILSAVICTLGLVEIGAVKSDGIPLSSLLFWTGNVLGILVFTPLALRIAERWNQRFSLRLPSTAFLWFLILTGIVLLGFCNRFTAHSILYPLAYLSFPLLVWLAVSLRKDVTFVVALVTTMATGFTAFGMGPLIRYDAMATYAEMTVFIMIYSVSCLILMAAVEEGRELSSRALDLKLTAVRNEADLRIIRANLNPHFLFNSLNSIKSLISENPVKAQAAVISLSEILRTSLRLTRNERVPLREELSVINSYLELQKIRHEHRLDCSLDVDPSSLDYMIPPMIFHQLVENAVKHGVESFSESTPIRIRCVMEGNGLLLSVENTGQLDFGHESGLGLHSIKGELAALYGEKAVFSLRQSLNHSVIAEIRLPAEI